MFSSNKAPNKRTYFAGFSDDSSDDESSVKKPKTSLTGLGFQFFRNLINNIIGFWKMRGSKIIDDSKDSALDNNETIIIGDDEECIEETPTRDCALSSQRKNLVVKQVSSKFENKSQVNNIPSQNTKPNLTKCKILKTYPSSAKQPGEEEMRFNYRLSPSMGVKQIPPKFEIRSHVDSIPIQNSKHNLTMRRTFKSYPSSTKQLGEEKKSYHFMPYPSQKKHNLYSLKANSHEIEVLNDSHDNSDDGEIRIVYERKPKKAPFTFEDYKKYSLLITSPKTEYTQERSRSSKPKLFTCNEVVRLEDKANYEMLLKKFRRLSSTISNERKKTKGSFVFKKPPELNMDEMPVYVPVNSSSNNDNKEDKDKIIEKRPYKPKRNPYFEPLETDWLEKLKITLNEEAKEMYNELEAKNRDIDNIHAIRAAFHEAEKSSHDNFQLTNGIIEENVTPEEYEFMEITEEMQEVIDNTLASLPNANDLLHTFSQSFGDSQVRRKDLDTLSGLNWLNDEIINAYLTLIVARNKLNDNYPSVFAFTTFFYTSLIKGYPSVRRWTRKIDIFSFDLNIVPLHLGFHWALGVIDHRKKKILYYDSLGGGGEDCLDFLNTYVCEESKDKKHQILDRNAYSKLAVKGLPHQMNGSDCGMFTLKYAEYISRDVKITFTQNNMPYFRKRTVYELITAKLLPADKS